jgi:hypothetical protein
MIGDEPGRGCPGDALLVKISFGGRAQRIASARQARLMVSSLSLDRRKRDVGAAVLTATGCEVDGSAKQIASRNELRPWIL